MKIIIFSIVFFLTRNTFGSEKNEVLNLLAGRCNHPCLNGGKCRNNKCRCTAGWKGERCAVRYNIHEQHIFISLLLILCLNTTIIDIYNVRI